MKHFILLTVIISQILLLPCTIQTNSKEQPNHYVSELSENLTKDIENNDALCEIENTKRTYLNIIEDLSFRNILWEQSSNFIKINDKLDLANLWGNGIRDKNGTLLYSISNDNIKLQLKNLFKDNLSWVIENNQNVIESFEISKFKKISKNSYCCKITYKSKHIDGYYQDLTQTIHIEKLNNYFKISGFSDITA